MGKLQGLAELAVVGELDAGAEGEVGSGEKTEQLDIVGIVGASGSGREAGFGDVPVIELVGGELGAGEVTIEVDFFAGGFNEIEPEPSLNETNVYLVIKAGEGLVYYVEIIRTVGTFTGEADFFQNESGEFHAGEVFDDIAMVGEHSSAGKSAEIATTEVNVIIRESEHFDTAGELGTAFANAFGHDGEFALRGNEV